MRLPRARRDEREPRRLLAFVRLLPSAGTGLLAVSVATQVAIAGLPIALSLAASRLIGAIPAAVRQGPGSPARDAVWSSLWQTAVIGLVLLAARTAGGILQARLGRRLEASIQQRLLAAVVAPIGVTHLEQQDELDRIDRARHLGGGRFNAGQGINALWSLGTRWLTAVLALGVVAAWSPLVSAALLVGYLALNLRLGVVLRRLLKVQAEETPELRRAGFLYDTGMSRDAAKEIRSFELGDHIVRRFHSSWYGAMEEVWAVRRGIIPRFGLLAVVDGLLTAGALALAVNAARRGDLTLTALFVQLQNIPNARLLAALTSEGLVLGYVADRAPVLLDLERDLERAAQSEETQPIPDGEPICFEDVRFRYPGGATDVLEGLTLRIEPGRSLAIVGPNGAGKTTIVKLLTRMHEPTAGRITVGGVDIRDFDPDAWQAKVAAIFQDFVRYELSAADNVGFGAPHLRDDPNALDRAAAAAGAADVIDGLGDGWATPLSPRLTGGADLSGGQWQRVALARALLALDGGAGVLVLDEPAAALDVRAEADLNERVLSATRGTTRIVISHRFSTVRHCERIVVVEQGRVTEDGTHESLVKTGGRYAELYELQAARFRDEVVEQVSNG